jgi:hypothetical protein
MVQAAPTTSGGAFRQSQSALTINSVRRIPMPLFGYEGHSPLVLGPELLSGDISEEDSDEERQALSDSGTAATPKNSTVNKAGRLEPSNLRVVRQAHRRSRTRSTGGGKLPVRLDQRSARDDFQIGQTGMERFIIDDGSVALHGDNPLSSWYGRWIMAAAS